MKNLKAKVLNWFRIRYEDRISLKWGIRQFIANVAFIQLNSREYIDLNPASEYIGMIRLTTSDMRPMLTYKYWPQGTTWGLDMPIVDTIVEERGFQVRTRKRVNANTDEVITSDLEVVDSADPRVRVLKDLFLSFAFYPTLRAEWKLPLEEQQRA